MTHKTKTRSATVSIIVGTEPIGGVIASKTFRGQENLCRTPQAAAREMKLWRSNRHWFSDNPHESAAFLFGLGVYVERAVIVLEQGEGGMILDPCKIYAARDGDGALRRSPASPGKPITVPSWIPIKFTEVLTTLQKKPAACSVLLYDGQAHFDPILYGEEAAADREVASITPPTEAPLPIVVPVAKKPLPGNFMAVHKQSAKAPIGKRLYTVTMTWGKQMQPGCKLIFHVPPLGKNVTVTLTERPAAGNLTLQLQLPDTVKEDSFTLGECHLVPAEEALVVMAQPLNKTALPVATAVPATTKRAADRRRLHTAAKKSKTASSVRATSGRARLRAARLQGAPSTSRRGTAGGQARGTPFLRPGLGARLVRRQGCQADHWQTLERPL